MPDRASWEFRKVSHIRKERIEAAASIAKEMWEAKREERSPELTKTVATDRAMFHMDKALGRIDSSLLAPLVRSDGTVISNQALVGDGPKNKPDLPGWPWNEDPNQSSPWLPPSQIA